MPRPPERPATPPMPPHPPGTPPPAVVIEENKGLVVVGDGNNIVFQEGDYAVTTGLGELLPVPPLTTDPTSRIFGRDALVAQVLADLADKGAVQLHGDPGVGKKAVAEAVHTALAARGTRGHVLWPRTGADATLDSVYQQLTSAFFGKKFLREVDEPALRAGVAQLDAHITLLDCPLGRADLARLRQTFPGCTFLITSRYATLPDSSAVHHVRPLSEDAAKELLSAELGLPLGPVGLQNLQFDHVCRVTGRLPQRLFQYAAFIKGFDDWRARVDEDSHDRPPPVDPAQLTPVHQAEALVVALSEPARRVLSALETFGTPLPAVWFAPVTGSPGDGDCAAELHARRLVVRHGDTYHLAGDAAEAVRRQEWPPADPVAAAKGLLTAFAAEGTPPPPDAHLLLVVAQRLRDAGEWALALRFVNATVPVVLAAGRGRIALQLYALGKAAATRGGRRQEAERYTREEGLTRNLLEGDKAAAAAALLVLAPAAGQVVAEGGKLAGLIGKFTATLTTKAGATVAAVSVAAVAATGVAVVASNSTPAGCDEARAATEKYSSSSVRTSADLATSYRESATELDAAATEATDTKIASALRGRADELRSLADTQQRDGDGLGPDVHPDVRAALLSSKGLRENIQSVQVVMKVCPAE
ncbi:ATP-binding protein [Streptomyces sp. NPDC002067]